MHDPDKLFLNASNCSLCHASYIVFYFKLTEKAGLSFKNEHGIIFISESIYADHLPPSHVSKLLASRFLVKFINAVHQLSKPILNGNTSLSINSKNSLIRGSWSSINFLSPKPTGLWSKKLQRLYLRRSFCSLIYLSLYQWFVSQLQSVYSFYIQLRQIFYCRSYILKIFRNCYCSTIFFC